MSSSLPGSHWRVLAQDGAHQFELRDAGVFDELVVDNWLHIEAMSSRNYWMQLGPLNVSLCLRKDGTTDILIERDGPRIGGKVTVGHGVDTGGKRLPGEDGATWRARRLKQTVAFDVLPVSGGETRSCYDGR